ncbi:MAG: hypothetical protein M3008_05845 [Chloroflexota bacterium]|nr:hypothetical protein [Chloroflexota bacterium]
MRHTATKADTTVAIEEDEPLQPEQVTVLEALLHGETVTDAARAAAVSPRTVHRWLKDDFVFQAAFNRERRALMEAMQHRLFALTTLALDTVEGAVKAGDVKAALAVIKAVGDLASAGPPIGSEDPTILREERESAVKEAANARRMQDLLGLS